MRTVLINIHLAPAVAGLRLCRRTAVPFPLGGFSTGRFIAPVGARAVDVLALDGAGELRLQRAT